MGGRRALIAALAALSVAACSSGPGSPSPSSLPPPHGLTLSSDAFGDGEAIPEAYTCNVGDGRTHPPLSWSRVPEGTAELAITVVDVDAGGFVHWAAWGIDPATSGLAEGEPPPEESENDHGSRGWYGPCPPGDEPHHYRFTLYALAEPSPSTVGPGAGEAVAEIQAEDSLAAATLTGLFPSP